jgi:hypothetical protein
MKSVNRNKIVRTIRRHKGNDGKPNSYEVDFMTFSQYDQKSEYKSLDGNIELYPYKWYNILYIYQIPSYWFLLLFNKFLKKPIKMNKRNHNTASVITLMLQIAALIKSLFALIG